jgi:hypothetical protein
MKKKSKPPLLENLRATDEEIHATIQSNKDIYKALEALMERSGSDAKPKPK